MSAEEKNPLYYAKRELIVAQRAIERMREAKSVEDLEDEWKTYLSAIEKYWIKVERACQHVRNRFQPWQGKYVRLKLETDVSLSIEVISL
jgi:hypothetical protein